MCICKRCQTKRTRNENKLISEYSRYLTLRDKFDRCNGIFQPIRAIVRIFDINDPDYPKNIIKTTEDMCLLRSSYSCINCDSKKANPEFVQSMTSPALAFNTEVQSRSCTVGYFSARKTHGRSGYILSCSFCRPKDFLMFQKFRGKAIAMNQASFCESNLYRITELMHSELVSDQLMEFDPYGPSALRMDNLAKVHRDLSMSDVTPECVIVYYFPINLVYQASRFLNRCLRYYEHKYLKDVIAELNEKHNCVFIGSTEM